jgi:hypothetical protein
MIVDADQLKRYIDIAGINADGFEVAVTAGMMVTNVMNNDRNVVLVAEMPIKDGSELKLRIQREIFLKYLRNLDGSVVGINADDTLITIVGGEVTIFFPQIVERITEKTKKPLPDTGKWDIQSIMYLTPQMVSKITSLADSLDEKIVTFVAVDGEVAIWVKKKAMVKKVATVAEGSTNFKVSYHIGSLKDAFSGARDTNVTLMLYKPVSAGRPPSAFAYSNGPILVSGLIAEWSEKE